MPARHAPSGRWKQSVHFLLCKHQITERLAIQEKDSNLLADVLSQRGMIDINRGKEYYSEAEQKILLAFKISRHIV